MPQQMDDELLQQAQAGEESAIAALITAMMPAIRKVLSSYIVGISSLFTCPRKNFNQRLGSPMN